MENGFCSGTIDYGTIVSHNAWTTRICFYQQWCFKPFITNTQGSCGCTVPTLQKSQLLQSKGIIGVKYATDRVGAVHQTVTVTSNADGQATKIPTIKVSY
jgi:hypothetical protein